MFTKKVRKGTRIDGISVARPITVEVIDWPAVIGALFVVVIVLGLIGRCTGG